MVEWGRSWLTETKPHSSQASALVAHVDLRGRIVADQHHREPGPALAARGEPVAVLANLAPDVRGDGLAVDDPGAMRPALDVGARILARRESGNDTGVSQN